MKQPPINTDTAKCQELSNTTKLEKVSQQLEGAKLIFAEPILNGLSDKSIAGLTLYFELPNGKQIAIETYSADMDSNLVVNKYI